MPNVNDTVPEIVINDLIQPIVEEQLEESAEETTEETEETIEEETTTEEETEETTEEEEAEALELEEFEYKGMTLYRDPDNKVYRMDEDGAVSDPLGLWDEKSKKIKKL